MPPKKRQPTPKKTSSSKARKRTSGDDAKSGSATGAGNAPGTNSSVPNSDIPSRTGSTSSSDPDSPNVPPSSTRTTRSSTARRSSTLTPARPSTAGQVQNSSPISTSVQSVTSTRRSNSAGNVTPTPTTTMVQPVPPSTMVQLSGSSPPSTSAQPETSSLPSTSVQSGPATPPLSMSPTFFSQITVHKIPKPRGRPSRKYPPLGHGKGRKSIYPEDQREFQQFLKKEHIPVKQEKNVPKDFWGTRNQPRRLDRNAKETEAERFKKVSENAKEAEDAMRYRPKKKSSKEATLLDESFDGTASQNSRNSGPSTNMRDAAYGVDDAMRKANIEKKQKEEVERQKLIQKENDKIRKRKQQMAKLYNMARAPRSRSVDPLDFDSPPITPAPGALVLKIPPYQHKRQSGSPMHSPVASRPPTPTHTGSPGGHDLSYNSPVTSSPTTRSPSKPPTPEQRQSKPAKTVYDTRGLSKASQTVVNDFLVDAFPRLAAYQYLKEQLSVWDPAICDRIKEIIKNLYEDPNVIDGPINMPIDPVHLRVMHDYNASPPSTEKEKNTFKVFNNSTEDFIIGFVTCIVESIYKYDSKPVPYSGSRHKGENEQRMKTMIDPHEIFILLVPAMQRALQELKYKLPFLDAKWTQWAYGKKDVKEQPGIRLPRTLSRSIFGNILDKPNNALFVKIGNHTVTVEDGKSLYPNQCMTDLTMTALVHLQIAKSQMSGSAVKANYISVVDFESNHLTGTHDLPNYAANLQRVNETISQIANWDVFIAPLHYSVNEINHWLVAVANRETHHIEIYDPFQPDGLLGNLENSEHRRRGDPLPIPVENAVTKRLNTLRLILNSVTVEEWCVGQDFKLMEFVKVPEIPRQRDGWACGPLCLCFIQQRLQLPEFYETANWQKMKNPGSGQLSLKLFRELQIRASLATIPQILSRANLPSAPTGASNSSQTIDSLQLPATATVSSTSGSTTDASSTDQSGTLTVSQDGTRTTGIVRPPVPPKPSKKPSKKK